MTPNNITQNLERLKFSLNKEDFDFIKKILSSTLKNTIKAKAITKKIDRTIFELKTRILELEQIEKTKRLIISENQKPLDIVKNKIQQQTEIFQNRISHLLNETYGKQGIIQKESRRLTYNLDYLLEKKKTKDKELYLPETFVEELEMLIRENSLENFNQLSLLMDDYNSRICNLSSNELEQRGTNFIYQPPQFTTTNTIDTILNESEKNQLSKFSDRVTNKKIGSYLIRARMIPMYLMMGFSMFGFRTGSNPLLKKFLGPGLLFIMGFAFFMIYREKLKEEYDSKASSLMKIKDNVLSEISRRSDETSNKLSRLTQEYLKKCEQDIFAFVSKTVGNSADEKSNFPLQSSPKIQKLKVELSNIERSGLSEITKITNSLLRNESRDSGR